MKKQIKKWGNSLVITFNPEDSRIHNLTEGKIINVYLSDNEETMILDYSLPCPLCSITIHGNSWVDVNEKFKIHIKSCKQRKIKNEYTNN